MYEVVFNQIKNYFGKSINILDLDRVTDEKILLTPYDCGIGFHFSNNYQNISLANKIIYEASKTTKIILLTISHNFFEIFKNYFCYFEVISKINDNFLVFFSNNYWYAGGNINQFNFWTDISHPLAQNSAATRRYFFSETTLLKQYDFNNKNISPINKNELTQEIQFLTNPQTVLDNAPKVLAYNINNNQGWILREKLLGQTLSGAIESNSYSVEKVINSILTQLTLLEKHGLYHNDLRTWNVFILESGDATLIDYGSISQKKIKTNVYLNFLVLCHELTKGASTQCRKFSPDYLLNLNYSKSYDQWIMQIINANPKNWKFSLFLDFLKNTNNNSKLNAINYEKFTQWLIAIKHLILRNKLRLRHFEPIFLARISSRVEGASLLQKIYYYITVGLYITYDSVTLKFKKKKS